MDTKGKGEGVNKNTAMANYKSQMDYMGTEEGYQVYRNKDGFMEGFKKIGRNKYSSDDSSGSDVKRIVSNQTTLAGFASYVRGLQTRVKLKDKPLKPLQLPGLPFPD